MYSYPLYLCMVSVGVDNPKVINIDINIFLKSATYRV